MIEFLEKVKAFVEGTMVPAQIEAVDYGALTSNPWFMGPFLVVIGYMVWTKSFKEMVLLAIALIIWVSSGTEYMNGLIINGELQMEKVLPVTFGGAVLLGIVIYMYFGRSE